MVPDTDVLAAELRTLGRAVPALEPGERLTVAVMARVDRLPTPEPVSRSRQLADRVTTALAVWRRRLALGLAAVLVALLVTPPVRAAVSDWFGFAGVIVREDQAPGPSSAPDPPGAATGLDLDRAADLAGLEPLVPAALGPPDGVEVSADRRVLSMSWQTETGGTVRLDEFEGTLDYAFAKAADGVRFTEVAGDFALWFARPHDVVLLEQDGTRRTESARLAGHTLIWVHGSTTMRLEGAFGLARATEIAESVVVAR